MSNEETKLERAAGRFGPGKQFFHCTTEEQVAALEELGFVTDPATLAEPYAPEEATHIKKLEDLVFSIEESAVEKAFSKKAEMKSKKKHAESEEAPRGNRLAT